MKLSWNIVFLIIQPGGLGPFEMGLVDISVGISDGRAEGVVCDHGELDNRDGLGSDLL